MVVLGYLNTAALWTVAVAMGTILGGMVGTLAGNMLDVVVDMTERRRDFCILVGAVSAVALLIPKF